MLLLGVVTGVAVGMFLPPILNLLLGPGWEEAERLALFMAPLVAVAVWVSPFGVAFYVFERPVELLVLNLSYVAITVLSFSLVTNNLHFAVALFVLLAMVRFLVMFMRVKRMVRHAGRV